MSVLVLLCSCTHTSGGSPGRAPGDAGRVTPAPSTALWQYTDPSFTALPGAHALYGRLGDALYEIEVPDNWNGEVVMYAHGFNGSQPFLLVAPPPLRQEFIDEGFAWAASSFSGNGYDPQAGVDDTLALLAYLKQNVGQPKRAYIYGSSMGGHVVVSSLEQHPDLYAGALSECGVVGGVEEMDYLVAYEAAGQYLAGLSLLPVTNIESYKTAVTSTLIPALGSPSSRRLTAKGQAFENVIEHLTGGPRPFRHEGFLDRFSSNFTVTFDELSRSTLAARAGTNANITYQIDSGFGLSDADLNAGIYRLQADPAVRNQTAHPVFSPMTGTIDTPLLSIHTTGDGFVPFGMEQDYRRLVEAKGNGDLLVQRAIRRPDHCEFTDAERVQAWKDLVGWVEQGVKPAGDDLLAGDPSQLGLRWTNPLLPGDPGGL